MNTKLLTFGISLGFCQSMGKSFGEPAPLPSPFQWYEDLRECCCCGVALSVASDITVTCLLMSLACYIECPEADEP